MSLMMSHSLLCFPDLSDTSFPQLPSPQASPAGIQGKTFVKSAISYKNRTEVCPAPVALEKTAIQAEPPNEANTSQFVEPH